MLIRRLLGRLGSLASYYWAVIRGTLGLSDCSGGPSWPVRLLNIGSVDSGGGTPRLPAMLLSSSALPRMVWWWYSWILQRKETPRCFSFFQMSDSNTCYCAFLSRKSKVSFIWELHLQRATMRYLLVCFCVSSLAIKKETEKIYSIVVL